MQGVAVGFEILGKITPLTNKFDVDILYKYLVHDSGHRLSWKEYYEESGKRSSEFGFLNLSLLRRKNNIGAYNILTIVQNECIILK